jgi:hypothetical protein
MPLSEFNFNDIQNITPPRVSAGGLAGGDMFSSDGFMRDWWNSYVAATSTADTVRQNGPYVQLQKRSHDFTGPKDEWLEGGTFAWDGDGSFKDYINTYHLGGALIAQSIEAGPFEPGRLVTAEVKVNGEVVKTEEVLGNGSVQEINFDNQTFNVPLTTEGDPPSVEIVASSDDFVEIARCLEYASPHPSPRDMAYSYKELPGSSSGKWTGQPPTIYYASKGYITEDQLVFYPGKPNPTNLSRPRGRSISTGGLVTGEMGVEGTVYGPLEIEMLTGMGSADLYVNRSSRSGNTQLFVSVDDGPLERVRFDRLVANQPTRYRASGGWLIPSPRYKTYSWVTHLWQRGQNKTTYWVVPDAVRSKTVFSNLPTQFLDPPPASVNLVQEGIEYYEVPGRGLYRYQRWKDIYAFGYSFAANSAAVSVEPRS